MAAAKDKSKWIGETPYSEKILDEATAAALALSYGGCSNGEICTVQEACRYWYGARSRGIHDCSREPDGYVYFACVGQPSLSLPVPQFLLYYISAVTHIDPEHFFIRELDGVRLVTPKAATVFADHVWTPENIHYRSRIETLTGETVSQGFKKFMNLGQGPDGLRVDAADVVNACVRGDAVATVKLDGSLLVRSVHQGQVLLRTRGAFSYQHQDNAHEIDKCTRRYPRLLDPTYLPDTSLLFEWVSPSNVIILKYQQSDLFLVGGVRHHDLRYVRLTELQDIAAHTGIELVEFFPLNENGWTDLYATLASDTEKEGYVIRLHGEQTLVKVKCVPYIAKHAFKYRMSTNRLIDMWFQEGSPSQQVFVSSLTHQFDEETIMWALPFIAGFFRAVQTVEEHTDAVRQEVDRHRTLSRKDFAIQMRQQLPSKDFSLAMLFWDNKAVHNRLLRQLLEGELAAAQIAPPEVVEEEA